MLKFTRRVSRLDLSRVYLMPEVISLGESMVEFCAMSKILLNPLSF
jgi:hypothetical protein